MNSQLDVIVPVFNEEENLPKLIPRIYESLTAANIPHRIFIIDDHSTDKTVKISEKLSRKYPVTLLSKQGQRGKGFSILEGNAAAQAPYVAMIDADLQYPPEVLPQMLTLTQEFGVVVARRQTHQEPRLRRFLSHGFQWFFGKVLHGLDCDVQSGLKLFKRDILRHVHEKNITAWTLDIPLLTTALHLGYKIGEIDIVFEKRQAGQSKIRLLQSIREIGGQALSYKFNGPRHFLVRGEKNGMIGFGVAKKGHTFITHTTLQPHYSALEVFTFPQKVFIFSLLVTTLAAFVWSPLTTAIAVVGTLSFLYFVDMIFNLHIIFKSLQEPPEIHIPVPALKKLVDSNLPVYSVLCPLYKEAHVLPQFVEAIQQMDWPKDKLDVMLLLEADDTETIAAAEAMNLPSYITIQVVPDSQPKTKPKACNYGLHFAKGEYLVIYDAEDKPDPFQLKKVYAAFQKAPESVKCIQAKLNFYNPHQNLLTRFFTAEYSLWFDVVLTGLQSVQTSIPLGGTSNHFRTAELRELEGWDPFNVTEDADLGIRLFKRGATTAIIDSVTLEEANSSWRNWLRQRSRWIKGYMQTYLVHMRNPLRFFREYGLHALLFQLVVGGKIAFMLINPLMWLLTLSYFALYAWLGPAIEAIYPSIVFYMAVTSLLFGNFMFLFYYMIGAAKREHWSIIKWTFLIPIYWLMVSVAAGIAIYQLIVKPHYWEKTVHGLHLKKKALEKEANKVAKVVIAEVAAHAEDKMLPNGPATFVASTQYPTRFKQIRKKLAFFSFSRTLHMLRHPIFREGGLYIAATMLANILNMLTNFYLGHALSLTDFGVFNIVVSLLYLTSIPVGALGSTVNYRVGYLLGKHDQASLIHFWRYLRRKTMYFSLVAAGVCLILAPWLPQVFNLSQLGPFISLAVILFLSLLLAVDSGYLSGRMMFSWIALITLAQPIARLLSALILVQLHPDLTYLSIIVGLLVVGAIAFFGARRDTNKFIETTEFHLPKKFMLAALLAGFSNIAFFSLDNLLVAHLLSAEDVGRYAMLGLFGKMIFFVGSLTSVFLAPIVSRYEGAGKNSTRIFFYTLLTVISMTLLAYFTFVGGVYFYGTQFLGEKILQIRDLLPIYGSAVALFTVSQVFVSYHLLKRRYLFPIVALLLSGMQIVALFIFHHSLLEVVEVMTAIGSLHLLVFTLLHVFYKQISVPLKNIEDLIGVFGKLPRSTISVTDPHSAKILIFNWRDTRHVWAGGAEAYVHEIAKRLVTQGHKVTVFCGNDGKSPRNEVIDGVQMVRRGGFYTVYIWAALYYVLRFRGLFDVVIDSENGIPFLTPLFVRKPIALIIYHVHQDVFRTQLRWPLSSVASFIEGTLMPFLYQDKQVITISESTRREILRHKISRSENIEVIHPGFEPQTVSVTRTKHPSFCYVGRLKPYKNLDVALKAFAELLPEFPNAVFTIGGEGESLSSLKSLAKELGISQQVKFRGKVGEHEKHKIFASHWVAVQPSMVEGWGITVIEANAHGTPVIASDVAGLRDSVQDQKTGILVEVNKIRAWSEAMKRLISNRTIRQTLGANAKKWSKQFSWDEAAQNFQLRLEKQIRTAESRLESQAPALVQSYENK